MVRFVKGRNILAGVTSLGQKEFDVLYICWRFFILAYWIAFGPHGPRALDPPGEGRQVFGIVVLALVVSCVLFALVRLLARGPPNTMTKEYQELTNEYLRVRLQNSRTNGAIFWSRMFWLCLHFSPKMWSLLQVSRRKVILVKDRYRVLRRRRNDLGLSVSCTLVCFRRSTCVYIGFVDINSLLTMHWFLIWHRDIYILETETLSFIASCFMYREVFDNRSCSPLSFLASLVWHLVMFLAQMTCEILKQYFQLKSSKF